MSERTGSVTYAPPVLPAPATHAGATNAASGRLAHFCATHAERALSNPAGGHGCAGQTGCRSFCGVDLDSYRLAPEPDFPASLECVVCDQMVDAWINRRLFGSPDPTTPKGL